MLERVQVTSYLTPLREGGSLPAIVEADNLGTYVLKFRGAGQGTLALVAEIIGGQLARHVGLRTPELALAELDPKIPPSEPDPEIQDLTTARRSTSTMTGPAPTRPSPTTPASTSSVTAPPGSRRPTEGWPP